MTEVPELEPGTLYVVGTPIGNLNDWSPRAQTVLSQVDAILSEDTRVTGLLCHNAGIHTPLISFHAHNTRQRIPEMMDRLKGNETLALVSDRGMPAISDPGQELIDALWHEGLRVSVIPGPTAAITAFVASGFPAPFGFWGFLPRGRSERRAVLQELAKWPHAAILYEAPHHMQETVRDLASQVGAERPVLLGREMTKRFEEFWRGELGHLESERREWRGECVLVLGPRIEIPGSGEVEWAQLVSRVENLVAGGAHPNEAIRQVARDSGVLRRELYQHVHETD
ncbi:MAG: 16S rRNA (cytidine(1402)-2'-O)-methyltransferase [Firmicutes bacterium]|nr:16S rRNA (cytidine(1402)-2'-O)-methyltransferase [Bacillota bacterium]